MNAAHAFRLVFPSFLSIGGAVFAHEASVAEGELARAERSLRSGRSVEAAEAFTAILVNQPGEERAIAGQLEAWIDADRWTRALDEIEGLGDAGRSRPELAGAIGAVLYRAGRIPEAGELLAHHAGSVEFTARGMSVLGAVRLAEGRAAEAGEWLERALAKDPDDGRIVLRAAEVARSRRETRERLSRYLRIAPDDDPDRREGARGTVAWLEVLGEREVFRAESRPERVDLPLAAIRDASGRAIAHTVQARLGEKERALRLLLDSGSGGVFLEERPARKAGLEVLAEETTFGGGGSGRHRTRRGVVSSIGFGGLRFVDALVTTSSAVIDPRRRYEGVLGPVVFDGYRLSFDLGEGRLTLDRSAPPLESGVPYWVVAGQILVRAAARGAPPGLFLVDTGATSSVLDLDYAAQVAGGRITDAAAAHGYGGAMSGARRVEGVHVEFLGRTTGEKPVVAADLDSRSRLGGVEVAGYLGMDLLAGNVLILDTRARRIDLWESPSAP